MASSWWQFWSFSKGASSPPANFLHFSRTNIERICKLALHEEPLNPHQCRHMSSMLERTMRSIERVVDSVDDIGLVSSSAALESFYRVSEKAKQLVENCCKDDWCQEAAFQIQNEEAFKEILLEASLCYNTICNIVESINRNKECLYDDLRESSLFDPSGAEEVSKDRVALHERLKGLVNNESASNCDIRSQHLGKYLLGRVNYALQHSDDEDFDVRSFNLWSDGNGPEGEWSEKENFLGGNVCKTTWLGVPCAKKHFQDDAQEDEWLAEAKILASLNHPNIAKFLCCNKCETEHTSSHFIAMEQMDTSLGSFIKRLKEEGAKLPLFSALDIILQIAYGMCYLHEHGIAHRDLKTSNVVVRKNFASQLQNYLQVKLVDFGISKMKLQDRSNTVTRPKIGTTVYMPPEAFSHGRANWFKADVYSFSVTCSVILSSSEPFRDVKRKDLCGAICSGKRPVLPRDIPKELASIIREGWAPDRNSRPNFVDICTRLEKLRHHLLRDHTLGSSFKQEELSDYSNLFIEKMLNRRSEAREHARSRARIQVAVVSIEEEEWFDGDEEFVHVPDAFSGGARNDRSWSDNAACGTDVINSSLHIIQVPQMEEMKEFLSNPEGSFAEELKGFYERLAVQNQVQGGKKHLQIDPTQRMRATQSKLSSPLSESASIENVCQLGFNSNYSQMISDFGPFMSNPASSVATQNAGRLPVSSADRVSVQQSPVDITFSSPMTNMAVLSAPETDGEESALRGISRNVEIQYLDFWPEWHLRNFPNGIPRPGSATTHLARWTEPVSTPSISASPLTPSSSRQDYLEFSYEQIFDLPGELEPSFPATVSPRGGLPLGPPPSSSRQDYLELSYEQIFDQPREVEPSFPETVLPRGGLPLDRFPDDPPAPSWHL